MLNSRELATVLAALRFYQRGMTIDGTVPPAYADHNIATDDGEHVPLTADEIDALCERINVAP